MAIRNIYPATFFEQNDTGSDQGLIILNQPITNGTVFKRVWLYSTIRVCADGGANRLYEYFSDDEETRQKYLPNCITGDLDSLRPEIKEYYENLNVPVIHNPDQESTDFMKAVDMITENLGSKDTPIIGLGAMGGRVDQSLHSIHHLFLSDQRGQEVLLLSDESVTFLLPTGTSTIHTPLKYLGKTCGIIPVAGPARITTSGLYWDVTDWETHFGGQMSTSNYLTKDKVEVQTDVPVIFTAELRQKN